MTVKPLEWDSDFFNKRIGEVFIDEESQSNGKFSSFDIIYVKSDSDIPFKIKGFVNTLVEQKLTFSKNKLNSKTKNDSSIDSFYNVDVDIQQLYDLALESGKYSRYKLDDNFNEGEFESLYKKWVDNSINKNFADEILVYSENDDVYGFITCKINNKIARVGLLGISPLKQGKGIGTKLLKSLEANLFKQGVEQINIPTQLKNEQACNFYTKLGYSIEDSVFIKHYWKL